MPKPKRRKPKFRVGQVVRVVGSPKFRGYLPDYFRISRIRMDKREVVLCVSDHDDTGPWILQSCACCLTRREKGN